MIRDVLKIKMKKKKMKRKSNIKIGSLKEYATTVDRKGILVGIVRPRNGYYKKFEKAKRAIDRDGDELVLCSLMSECK